MKKGRFIFGLILVTMGVISLINLRNNIVGSMINVYVSSFFNSVLGLIFIIGGFILLVSSRGYDYYEKRVKEITKYKGDIWISQWEADGLLNELKDGGFHIEHGSDMPAMHLGSLHAPRQRHVHIENKRRGVNKHLYITPDPGDPRLNVVGVKEIGGGKLERILSKVYHPKHPRKSGREKKKFADKTVIPVRDE